MAFTLLGMKAYGGLLLPPLAWRAGGPGPNASIWLRNRDRFNRHRSNALFPHAQIVGRSRGHVENSARHVGSTVLHPDSRLLLAPEVLDSGNGAER